MTISMPRPDLRKRAAIAVLTGLTVLATPSVNEASAAGFCMYFERWTRTIKTNSYGRQRYCYTYYYVSRYARPGQRIRRPAGRWRGWSVGRVSYGRCLRVTRYNTRSRARSRCHGCCIAYLNGRVIYQFGR